ncbi:hypothetical protein F8M41_001958 [Gigaspora margarita]|uniref:Uncharacterized protein n=1 Tax=Gigaspora margarita TaxID=4874 RepID=A0A8H3XGL9_GIGMA|nr:hypothetical protein F8M41_001958 [Gigaspora margarita]
MLEFFFNKPPPYEMDDILSALRSGALPQRYYELAEKYKEFVIDAEDIRKEMLEQLSIDPNKKITHKQYIQIEIYNHLLHKNLKNNMPKNDNDQSTTDYSMRDLSFFNQVFERKNVKETKDKEVKQDHDINSLSKLVLDIEIHE